MTCSACHRPMRRIESFLFVSYECEPCARGEAPPQKHGDVLLDRGTTYRLCNGERLDLMTFKSLEDARNTVARMTYANLVQRVEFEIEPAWEARLMRPEDLVARCEIWVDADGVFRGRKVGG